MDLGSAILGFLTVFVIKGAVMLVSFVLLVRVRRAMRATEAGHSADTGRQPWIRIPPEHLPEMRISWWGVALFLLAELGCAGGAVVIMVLDNGCLDVVHSMASGAGMALFGLGVYIYLDRKLLRFGDNHCLVNRICHGCTVAKGRACKFNRLILLMAVLALLMSFFPFWVITADVPIDPLRVALPVDSWNQWYDAVVVPYLLANVEGYKPGGEAYFIPKLIMDVELRLLPAAAALMALVCLVQIRRGREHDGLKWLAATLGLLGYVYFEILLYPGTGDAMLGSLGHELIELWFLAAFWVFVRRAFPPEPPRARSVAAMEHR